MSMFEIHGGFTGLAASSRVRLARNIKGYPFRLTEQQHSEIADKVFAALKENPTIGPEFEKKQIIPRSTEASRLVEEHLISPELAQNGGWLIVSKDGGVSIMVGDDAIFEIAKGAASLEEKTNVLIEQANENNLGLLMMGGTDTGKDGEAAV